jgi:hypothetical protein
LIGLRFTEGFFCIRIAPGGHVISKNPTHTMTLIKRLDGSERGKTKIQPFYLARTESPAVRPVAPRTRRRAAGPAARRYAPVIKPVITGVTPLPAPSGSIITILGRNFNPYARLNRIRVPIATGRRAKFRKSGVRSRTEIFGYRFARAVSGDAQGTQLRVRLPRNLRSGRGTYILVYNGRAYSQYYRLQIGGLSRRAGVARGRGVVLDLRNQPTGSVLALLQRAASAGGGG